MKFLWTEFHAVTQADCDLRSKYAIHFLCTFLCPGSRSAKNTDMHRTTGLCPRNNEEFQSAKLVSCAKKPFCALDTKQTCNKNTLYIVSAAYYLALRVAWLVLALKCLKKNDLLAFALLF